MTILKKLTAIATLLLSCVLLVSCLGEQKTELQFIGEEEDYRITIYHQGDRVTKEVRKTTILTDFVGEAVRRAYKDYELVFEQTKGVNYTADFEDDRVIATLTLDSEKIEFDKFKNYYDKTGALKKDYISYKELIKHLKKRKFKIIENQEFQELPNQKD